MSAVEEYHRLMASKTLKPSKKVTRDAITELEVRVRQYQDELVDKHNALLDAETENKRLLRIMREGGCADCDDHTLRSQLAAELATLEAKNERLQFGLKRQTERGDKAEDEIARLHLHWQREAKFASRTDLGVPISAAALEQAEAELARERSNFNSLVTADNIAIASLKAELAALKARRRECAGCKHVAICGLHVFWIGAWTPGSHFKYTDGHAVTFCSEWEPQPSEWAARGETP